MISPLAVSLVGVLGAIGLLHLAWAFGMVWPGSDAVSLADKVLGARPGSQMPPTWLTAGVAIAILVAAALVWQVSAQPPGAPWGQELRLAYLALTLVFLARGLAGYLPRIWRRTRTTAFYPLNRLYYSPLCLLIAAGLAVNFTLG